MMATISKNRKFLNGPKQLYLKPKPAQILTGGAEFKFILLSITEMRLI